MEALAILFIEDDKRLADFTGEYLQSHGMTVTHAATGDVGLREALKNRHDVVLLDLMLPVMDGLTVCRQLRERSDVPILMVTARAEEIDRVLGLELGADDYISKPFSPRELLARIHATMRRVRGLVGPASTLRGGGLSLEVGSMTATLDGRPLTLTGYEFAILRVLLERRGRVLTRERLLELAKGSVDESFDRSVDVRISRLRQKLRDHAPDAPVRITTVRGAGYMLVVEGET